MFIENRTTTGPTSLSETIKHINGERDKYRERVPTGIKNRRQLRLVTARVVKCWCSVWWRGERGGCTPAVLTGSPLASRFPRRQIDLYQSIYQSLISIFFYRTACSVFPPRVHDPMTMKTWRRMYIWSRKRERGKERHEIYSHIPGHIICPKVITKKKKKTA